MTREEAIKDFLRHYTGESTDMAIKALEQEPNDKQRYVVRGINNDKIEFVDKYSVRAFNRYVEFIKRVERVKRKELLDKIRAEIIELRSKQNVSVLECLDIIDNYKSESEDKE